MELHDDDKPIGRLLSRREMLALLGGGSLALIAGLSVPNIISAQGNPTPTPSATPLPACVVRPELTEGPYFVDNELKRIDIRSDEKTGIVKEGLPLYLVFRVSNMTGGVCAPLPNAQVDIWHCDADGIYSGVQDRYGDTRDQLWLRGFQTTDAGGHAEFLTVVPGWYPGRAVHIHFKIRVDQANGRVYDYTSQLFFDPAEIAKIYAQPPYAAKGLPNTPNSRDGIFNNSDGLLTLTLAEMDEPTRTKLKVESGVSATFDVGLDMA